MKEIYKKTAEDKSGDDSGQNQNTVPPSGVTPDRSFESLSPMEKLLTGISLAAHEIRKKEFLSRKTITGPAMEGNVLSKVVKRVFRSEKPKREIDEVYENPVLFDVSTTTERCIVPQLENGRLTITMPLTTFYHRRYFSEEHKANVRQTVSGALQVSGDLLAKSQRLLENEEIRNDVVQYCKRIFATNTDIYTLDGKDCREGSHESQLTRRFGELLNNANVLRQLVLEFVDFDNSRLGGLITEDGHALKLSIPDQ